jgi:metal-responsive CopG/Arc/MetJ family transcriptional regulator
MARKVKHVIVRITEAQFRWLADILLVENRNRSEVMRDALNRYLIEQSHENKNGRKSIGKYE